MVSNAECANTERKSQPFMLSSTPIPDLETPNKHVFGLWEETRALRGNHAETEGQHKLHKESLQLTQQFTIHSYAYLTPCVDLGAGVINAWVLLTVLCALAAGCRFSPMLTVRT